MIQSKHVIRFSFIGLFLNILLNIIFYRYFMIEDIILNQLSQQNFNIVEIYKQRIWGEHQAAITKLHNSNHKNLLTDNDFIRFMQDSIKFFEGSNLQITLIDMKGNRFLTNNHFKIADSQESSITNLQDIYDLLIAKIDQYFLKNLISNNALNQAFKGLSSNILLHNAIGIDNKQQEYQGTFIRSYMPIIKSKTDNYKIEAVLQIDHDITAQWQNISYLEKRVLTTFIIVFIVFFVIVMYNTRYAQRIINKQLETNRSLEEAKLKAENESKAKTEFLANISHELRTPLNAIIGFSEIILSENYGKMVNLQYREYVQDINNSGKHLLSVINDILDFSKASADKLKVEHIEIDLTKLASSSMRFIKPRADEAKVHLIEDMPPEHIIIKADPKRLKQALLNLISNSVKFTPENGSVTLLIEKDKLAKLVHIKVIDTGIGMAEKDIPKALSSFGQIDNSLSRKYEGTGLGLPLTKKLVELMQGQFNLQSSIGVGTTVTLTFKYDTTIQYVVSSCNCS